MVVSLATLRTVVGGPVNISLFLIAISPLSIVASCMLPSARNPRLTLLLVSVATSLRPLRARTAIIRLQVLCILTWRGPIVW